MPSLPTPWAVLGVGIAGRARARAIADDPRARLVGVVVGRFAESVADELEVPVLPDLDAAIERAEAVAVCTPSPLHPEHVEQVLGAGRHAVVEFPLAPSRAVGAELFARARAGNLLLHVEHIELLTGAAVALRGHGPFHRAHVGFTSSGDGDVESLVTSAVARLHRLIDAAGPLASAPVRSAHASDGRLDAEVLLASGLVATFTVERRAGLPRNTVLELDGAHRWRLDGRDVTRDGAPVSLPDPGPLFLADQRAASARLHDGAAPYVDEATVLAVLGAVDALRDAVR